MLANAKLLCTTKNLWIMNMTWSAMYGVQPIVSFSRVNQEKNPASTHLMNNTHSLRRWYWTEEAAELDMTEIGNWISWEQIVFIWFWWARMECQTKNKSRRNSELKLADGKEIIVAHPNYALSDSRFNTIIYYSTLMPLNKEVLIHSLSGCQNFR